MTEPLWLTSPMESWDFCRETHRKKPVYDAVRKPEEVIQLHKQLYGNMKSGVKNEADFSPNPVPERIAYQPTHKKEAKKTGWEPYGWKRGVALVILFFVLMGIMYGPKIYKRYQMDHGGIVTEESQGQP